MGAGVVGVATGRGLSSQGITVSYFDVSRARTEELGLCGLDVRDASELVSAACSGYLISVSTPTRGGRIDLSAVEEAAKLVGLALADTDEWRCVVVRSTVPPGTTEEVVLPILEQYSRAKAGHDFGLAMNPEFLRAASADADFLNPRVIVFGSLDARTEGYMRHLYGPWKGVTTYALTLREAEATKYVANTFNAAKISFFNELHTTLEKMGIESSSAFAAATMGAEGLWNPRYGTNGGLPFGGACLPKDTAAFLAFSRDMGVDPLMLAATVETNVRVGGPDLLSEDWPS